MNPFSKSYSSTTSSNINSQKYSNYSNDPFSNIQKSSGKGSTDFYINYQNQLSLSNDIAYYFLSSSNIILTFKYEKGKNETIINYKKISYNDKDGFEKEITIEELKMFSSEDYKMNIYFKKFIEYLKEVEKEIKDKYKEEKETEIFMEIKMHNFENFDFFCTFYINDGRKDDNTFTEENFLNNSHHEALYCMVEALVE